MDLTVDEIKEDIAEYEDRIHLARMNLGNLPEGRLNLKEHKLRQKRRNEYESEIKFCETLISYALEGIELRQQEVGCCH